MQRSMVDFPAPDGPMTQTTSPLSTSSVTSRRTTRWPKDLQIFSRRIIGYPAFAMRRLGLRR